MGLGHCRWNVDQCRLLSVKVSERKIRLSRDSSDLAEWGTSSEEKTGGVLQAECGTMTPARCRQRVATMTPVQMQTQPTSL